MCVQTHALSSSRTDRPATCAPTCQIHHLASEEILPPSIPCPEASCIQTKRRTSSDITPHPSSFLQLRTMTRSLNLRRSMEFSLLSEKMYEKYVLFSEPLLNLSWAPILIINLDKSAIKLRPIFNYSHVHALLQAKFGEICNDEDER